MPAYKRIYAATLLVIFSMVTFHDLMPHAHHDHDDVNAHDVHHHDHHEHEIDGLLAAIGHILHLHKHSHSDCEIDECPEIPALKQGKRLYKDHANVIAVLNDETFLSEIDGAGNALFQWVERSCSDELARGISQRGPPAPSNC